MAKQRQMQRKPQTVEDEGKDKLFMSAYLLVIEKYDIWYTVAHLVGKSQDF